MIYYINAIARELYDIRDIYCGGSAEFHPKRKKLKGYQKNK